MKILTIALFCSFSAFASVEELKLPESTFNIRSGQMVIEVQPNEDRDLQEYQNDMIINIEQDSEFETVVVETEK